MPAPLPYESLDGARLEARANGNFDLWVTGTISWVAPPPEGMVIGIRGAEHRQSFPVSDDGTFEVRVDVAPTYLWLGASAPGWRANRGLGLRIDAEGVVECVHGPCAGPMVLGPVLRVTSPKAGAVVETPRPTFTWTEVPYATTYAVRWADTTAEERLTSATWSSVPDETFTLPTDLVHAHAYEWEVVAFDAAGTELARETSHLYAPGGSDTPWTCAPAP